jgi:probable rRNA maturation factor
MKVVIANRQRTKKVQGRRLKQIVEALLRDELEIREAELGIHLVGAREMARVNWQFLRHEGSTDVITFDHLDPAAPGPKLRLHGELFICVDDAVAQAREFGTTWQEEVVRYAVHGGLHLLGYDDLKPAWRRKMKRQENRLVKVLASRFSLAQLSRPVKLAK